MEKKQKILYILLCVLVVGSIIWLDVKAVMYIRDKNIESYQMSDYHAHKKKLKKKVTKTAFFPVSSQICTMCLEFEGEEEVDGTIVYKVLDEEGNTLRERQRVDVAAVRSGNQIALDISGPAYQAGKKYVLKVKYKLKDTIMPQWDKNGLVYVQKYKADYQYILYIGLAAVNLLAGILLFFCLKFGFRERLFFAVSVFIGVCALLFSAPYTREDSFRHFVRAYDLSFGGGQGKYDVPDQEFIGVFLPDDDKKGHFLELPKELSSLRCVSYWGNMNSTAYDSEVNTSLCLPKLLLLFSQPEEEGVEQVSEYATVYRGYESYWPQALGIQVGRMFGVRSGFLYYMAALSQALVCSLLFYAASRLTKAHKKFVYLYCLLPPVSLLCGSTNPDGLMMAEIILCLATILHLREHEVNLMSKKGALLLVGYGILLLMVAKMKIPYGVLVAGFCPLLKRENFAFVNRDVLKKYRWFIGIGAAGVCAVGVVCMFVLQGGELFLGMIYRFVPKEHWEYIIENPELFFPMYLEKGGVLLKETLRALTGSWFIPYYVLIGAVLLFSKKQFTLKSKCYQIGLYVCVLGLIVLAGYTLTPPDYGTIWGISYRYMLPAIPIFLLALPAGNERTEAIVERVYSPLLLVSVFASAVAWLQI